MNRQRLSAHITLLLLLCFAYTEAYAQSINDVRRPNPEGRHTITGIVFAPTGKPAGKGIMVKVSKWGDDIIAWTDDDGEFRVSGMGNGTFTVAVSPDGDLESDTQRVVITLPDNAPAQIFNVDLQLKSKQAGQSRTGVIDAELASVPKKALKHYVAGKEASSAGDNKAAIEQHLKAIEIHPEFALAHLELGEIFQQLNELERADEHLRTAVKLKPDAYEPLAARGVTQVRLKRFAEAETSLRAALKIKDESPVVRFYLGRALVALKRPDEAESEFRSALQKGGNGMNEARRALANIYLDRNDHDSALNEIDAYLAVNPTPADEKNLRTTAQWLRERIKERTNP